MVFNSPDYYPAKITKADKDFAKKTRLILNI